MCRALQCASEQFVFSFSMVQNGIGGTNKVSDVASGAFLDPDTATPLQSPAWQPWPSCLPNMPWLGCKIFSASTQNGVHFGSFRRPYNIGDSTRSAEAVRQLFAAKGLPILQLTANLPGPLTQVFANRCPCLFLLRLL